MHQFARRARTVGAALLLGLLVLGAVRGVVAQDGTPAAGTEGRPAHIHSGGCGDDLGDVVQALTNLTSGEGEDGGQDAAVVAEGSFTSVPLALDDILADDHAINVHLSTEEIGTYIACGEIGGPVGTDGSLSIGLKEQSNSGFTGIAYLAPGEDDASTDVSVFVAEDLTAGGADADEGATEDEADAFPAASAGGEAVEVSLTEWAIEMPTTLAAGTISFNMTNEGEFPHTIEIEGQGIEVEGERIEPGQTGTLEVDLEPGTYTVYCPVGDGRHREQGMDLELTVE